MLTLPNDPTILLSYINTQLRDNYKSLTELCKASMADENMIMSKLASIGYAYDSTSNQFI